MIDNIYSRSSSIVTVFLNVLETDSLTKCVNCDFLLMCFSHNPVIFLYKCHSKPCRVFIEVLL